MTNAEAIAYVRDSKLPITCIITYGADECWYDLYGHKLIELQSFMVSPLDPPYSTCTVGFKVISDLELKELCVEKKLDYLKLKELIDCIIRSEKIKYKELCKDLVLRLSLLNTGIRSLFKVIVMEL